MIIVRAYCNDDDCLLDGELLLIFTASNHQGQRDREREQQNIADDYMHTH